MASLSLRSPLLLLTLLFISPTTLSLSLSERRSLVAPVTKDAATGQYLVSLHQRTPSVPVKLSVDLAGAHVWINCENGYNSSTYKNIRCPSQQCSRAFISNCGVCFWNSVRPCDNSTCTVFIDNPFTNFGAGGRLADDVLSLTSTDGSNPGPRVIVKNFLFACSTPDLFTNGVFGVSSSAVGVAGLGRDSDALPSQLSKAFGLSRTFAICLSSSTGPIFFGDGPYKFSNGFDPSTELIYTPLLQDPVYGVGPPYDKRVRSVQYYLNVTGIRINDKTVLNRSRMLQINKGGYGGVVLSSAVRYTRLYTPIYKVLLREFGAAMSGVQTVPPVAPFDLCFGWRSYSSTDSVPSIDIVFQRSDVYWRISESNSMVRVSADVMCLAFVDAFNVPPASIMFGGYQLEDNFLLFDLEKLRLGFMTSMLDRKTSCANFNFTSRL